MKRGIEMYTNPLMMAMQMAQAGKNPMALLQSMAQSNPQMAQALQMMQGKSPADLRKVAENMAKERGIDLEQMAQSMGIKLPK